MSNYIRLGMRLSKPWQIFQARPTMAVTGSSRGCSIPREHSSWRGKGGYISVGKNMRRLASGESVA
jgi:hypothetical protein